ncbi:hypothetical protein OK006_7949 [Actinobacteria bacterium OK006]|nr:hypothetical protein OK006_7949 [Actinobacteria bacterium OK006]
MLLAMKRKSELREFLSTRRPRLRPEDIGLPLWRQAAGSCLRRVAQLAGVSTGYDTRLEQGQIPNTSDVVLDAVTRVLQLDETERAYLHTLARPQPRVRTHHRPEQVRPWAQALIDLLRTTPALTIDRCGDVLTWNRTAQGARRATPVRRSLPGPLSSPTWRD